MLRSVRTTTIAKTTAATLLSSTTLLSSMTLLWCATLLAQPSESDRTRRSGPVGVSTTLRQVVLPGSELEAKPLDRDGPIVLRITGAYRHGTDYRYDMEYYGLEPGRHDLTDYLRRKDGTSTDDLPELWVSVEASLPPGQIEPNRLESGRLPRVGGYRLMLILGGIAWLAGLLAILLVGRGRRGTDAGGEGGPPRTLADRLRPMIDDAVAGRLTTTQQAELERMLLAVWRKRLDLTDVKAAEAMTVLRRHEEAGPLLRQLEQWLHRPGDSTPVDVGRLLEPYRNLPADAPETAVS